MIWKNWKNSRKLLSDFFAGALRRPFFAPERRRAGFFAFRGSLPRASVRDLANAPAAGLGFIAALLLAFSPGPLFAASSRPQPSGPRQMRIDPLGGLFRASPNSSFSGTAPPGQKIRQTIRQKNYKAHEAPAALRGLEIKERLGSSLDLGLTFRNEEGDSVPLSSYFGSQPVLMTMIYYNCPSLCNFHLNGLFRGLQNLSLTKSKDYHLAVVSMDSREGPALAKEKKTNYLKKFGLPKGKTHFLTGAEDSIKRLADQLGFAFRWDEETEQFAHSPVAYVLTPEGVISRYLYGVEFQPKTLKLSLLEGARGKIGNIMDRILLFCYRFNPGAKRYTLYAYNIMRAGGALTILLLAVFLLPFWMREKKV